MEYPMPIDAKSDDFIDGLQAAFKAIYHLKERVEKRSPQWVDPLKAALAEIDKEINKAAVEKISIIVL